MISIVIPTRNEEKILRETLTRLRDGLRGGLSAEIIVSDGSSTDGTLAVAREFADRVIEETGGRHTIGWGRNRGAEAAGGDYLVFLDADVAIPRPAEFFRIALAEFESRPHLVALTAKIKVTPESETWADRIIFWTISQWFRFLNNVCRYGMAGGEFQMIRTPVFRELGGFHEELAAAEDVEMFARLSKKGLTRLSPRLTIFHTGRRAHAVGWPRLLWSWFKNWASMLIFKKSASTEWTPIR